MVDVNFSNDINNPQQKIIVTQKPQMSVELAEVDSSFESS